MGWQVSKFTIWLVRTLDKVHFAVLLLWAAMLVSLLVFLINVSLDPNWLATWLNVLQLVGLIFLGAVAVYGTLHSSVISWKDEVKRFLASIEAIDRQTNHALRVLMPKTNGIRSLISRPETDRILEQMKIGRNVLLVGEAGSGKSGIGYSIFCDSGLPKEFKIYIDARTLANLQNPGEFREHFDVHEAPIELISRFAAKTGVMLIVDQMDNIAGARGEQTLINFMIDCSRINNVRVMAISRRDQGIQREVIEQLIQSDFFEIPCRNLESEEIVSALRNVNILEPSEELVELCRNILNLSIVCNVARNNHDEDLSQIHDQIRLWEVFWRELATRESRFQNFTPVEFLAEAVRLATLGLAAMDRSIQMELVLTAIQNRLISSNILVLVQLQKYQFAHERLQDYLYAWGAVNRGLLVNQVLQEIDEIHSRSVFDWMARLYRQADLDQYERFLEEAFRG